MSQMSRSRYVARFAEGQRDRIAAQMLRARAFRGRAHLDADAYDDICRHLLIEDRTTRELVACCRLMPLCGAEIEQSYAAQFYGLSRLSKYPGRMLEMGRFCAAPGTQDLDILRTAWAALTTFVDAEDINLLFGCASFRGTDTEVYLDAFSLLRERYLAPPAWQPEVKAPDIVVFGPPLRKLDMSRALRSMPSLLRTYLTMGGWVSDHAVVDRDLGTLHVFTGLEVNAISPGRARALRRTVLDGMTAPA